MFALFQIAVLCTAADAAPGYTVHVRGLTAPEQTIRQIFTGSETVHDAVATLPRPADAADMDLWIARRSKGNAVQILRIDWIAITQHGETKTNYQILDGDRLFVQARPVK